MVSYADGFKERRMVRSKNIIFIRDCCDGETIDVHTIPGSIYFRFLAWWSCCYGRGHCGGYAPNTRVRKQVYYEFNETTMCPHARVTHRLVWKPPRDNALRWPDGFGALRTWPCVKNKCRTSGCSRNAYGDIVGAGVSKNVTDVGKAHKYDVYRHRTYVTPCA